MVANRRLAARVSAGNTKGTFYVYRWWTACPDPCDHYPDPDLLDPAQRFETSEYGHPFQGCPFFRRLGAMRPR